jgi:hypothetical protein
VAIAVTSKSTVKHTTRRLSRQGFVSSALVGCGPNARCQPPLEAVGCTPLILIEAPSSAYPGGMLRAGDYHS